MRRYIGLGIIVMLFICCGIEELSDPNLPTCIVTMVNQEKIGTVLSMNVEGESHYRLRKAVISMVEGEYILNSSCDTICSTCGECSLVPCYEIYQNLGPWKVLWPQ